MWLLSLNGFGRYRSEAIDALRSNAVPNFLRLFHKVDWRLVSEGPDEAKQVAFMVAQTVALLQDEEVYTKASIAKVVPAAESALFRRPDSDVNGVLHLLRGLLDARCFSVSQHGSLALCKLKSETCLCSFEKNQTRLIGLIPSHACFVRLGNLVLSLSPVNWKAKVKELPKKAEHEFEVFDSNHEVIRTD